MAGRPAAPPVGRSPREEGGSPRPITSRARRPRLRRRAALGRRAVGRSDARGEGGGVVGQSLQQQYPRRRLSKPPSGARPTRESDSSRRGAAPPPASGAPPARRRPADGSREARAAAAGGAAAEGPEPVCARSRRARGSTGLGRGWRDAELGERDAAGAGAAVTARVLRTCCGEGTGEAATRARARGVAGAGGAGRGRATHRGLELADELAQHRRRLPRRLRHRAAPPVDEALAALHPPLREDALRHAAVVVADARELICRRFFFSSYCSTSAGSTVRGASHELGEPSPHLTRYSVRPLAPLPDPRSMSSSWVPFSAWARPRHHPPSPTAPCRSPPALHRVRSCRAPLRDGALIVAAVNPRRRRAGLEPLDLGFSGGAGAGSDIPSLIYAPDRPVEAAPCAESDVRPLPSRASCAAKRDMRSRDFRPQTFAHDDQCFFRLHRPRRCRAGYLADRGRDRCGAHRTVHVHQLLRPSQRLVRAMRRNSTQLFVHTPSLSTQGLRRRRLRLRVPLCTFGSDCSDCGPRTGSSRGIPSRYRAAAAGSTTAAAAARTRAATATTATATTVASTRAHLCTFGSDCGDCGSRAMRLAEEPPAELAPEALVEQKHAKTIRCAAGRRRRRRPRRSPSPPSSASSSPSSSSARSSPRRAPPRRRRRLGADAVEPPTPRSGYVFCVRIS